MRVLAATTEVTATLEQKNPAQRDVVNTNIEFPVALGGPPEGGSGPRSSTFLRPEGVVERAVK